MKKLILGLGSAAAAVAPVAAVVSCSFESDDTSSAGTQLTEPQRLKAESLVRAVVGGALVAKDDIVIKDSYKLSNGADYSDGFAVEVYFRNAIYSSSNILTRKLVFSRDTHWYLGVTKKDRSYNLAIFSTKSDIRNSIAASSLVKEITNASSEAQPFFDLLNK